MITYDADQSEEDAWTNLVTTETSPKSSLSKDLYSVKIYRTDGSRDGCYGICIDSCRVRGLADISSPDILLRGTLDVKVDSTIERTFDVVADHGFLIPNGAYFHGRRYLGGWKNGGTREEVYESVSVQDG
ncbi:hypothetical protein IW261DRAFT_1426317 [Armillaria novae-zelandiae]|uniref:Uncharacterized protein n=1 Tax=Armillaria novae-zelandiae TaxID=153914 RepID=A0AA39NN00_9AGAR|nr:hypothetical protein IW261DRAFT_1426317 [Armillaria novae-zelandiae]